LGEVLTSPDLKKITMLRNVTKASEPELLAGFCECGNKTFRFHKMRGIYLLAENPLASQEGLCSMELVKVGIFKGRLQNGSQNVNCVLIFQLQNSVSDCQLDVTASGYGLMRLILSQMTHWLTTSKQEFPSTGSDTNNLIDKLAYICFGVYSLCEKTCNPVSIKYFRIHAKLHLKLYTHALLSS
jgi:hypothetical protein